MSTRIRITLRAGMIVPGQFSMSFIILFYIFSFLSVISLPLGPASLMHKKMQNKSCMRPVCVISVAVIMAVV